MMSINFRLQVAAEISTIINLQIEKARTKGLRLQPYLLTVGDQIDKTYVVIDSIQYEFNTCLHAFDILFKSFHALNICYPPQSEHLYELIEVVIWKINRTDLKNIPYIQDVISYLKEEVNISSQF